MKPPRPADHSKPPICRRKPDQLQWRKVLMVSFFRSRRVGGDSYVALRRASRTLETAVEHVVSRCCCVASEGCVDRNPSPLAGSWRSASFLHPLAGNSPYTFATFFSGLELVAPGRRSGRVGYVPSILRSACRPEMRGQFSVRSVRSPTTARQDMFGGDAPDRGKKRSPSEIVVTEESTCLISSDLANPTSISR